MKILKRSPEHARKPVSGSMCHTVTQAKFPVYCLLDTRIEIKGVSANSKIKRILRTCLMVVIIITRLPLSANNRAAKDHFDT